MPATIMGSGSGFSCGGNAILFVHNSRTLHPGNRRSLKYFAPDRTGPSMAVLPFSANAFSIQSPSSRNGGFTKFRVFHDTFKPSNVG